MESSIVIDELFEALPSASSHHAVNSTLFKLFNRIAMPHVKALFSESKAVERDFGPFGKFCFPFHRLGNLDTTDLFVLNELIILSFYAANRGLYKKALDLGANLGLHTIAMSKMGLTVEAYEPDPTHFKILKENIDLNKAENIHLHQEAVSDQKGTVEFVRVMGNTTSSHIAGSKNPYGELERYPVPVVDIRDLLDGVDLIKMDVEGQEGIVISALSEKMLQKVDMLVEVGSLDNAKVVFDHVSPMHVNMFAQNRNWQKVQTLDDMPSSCHHGTLFISAKDEMPWGNFPKI